MQTRGRWTRRALCRRVVAVFIVAAAVDSTAFAGGAERKEVPVCIDPRTELASIIFRLAGYNEYNQTVLSEYAAEVDAHFGPHREHPVISYARELRAQDGVGFNACVDIVLHATDLPELEPRFPLDSPTSRLDRRWNAENGSKFLRLARDFAAVSDFQAFLDAHRRFYEDTEQKMRHFLDENFHRDWYADFFLADPTAQFRLVIGLLNGGANYAATVVMPSGHEEINCVLGVWRKDETGAPRFGMDALDTIAHEFAHAYINPFVARNAARLEKSCIPVFKLVENRMRRMAYPDWQIMMNESLVRASVIRYLETHHSAQLARESQASDEAAGFMWVGGLAELLKKYERSRDGSRSLDALVPEICDVMEAVYPAVERQIREEKENAPKLVSMEPANGASDVDPNLASITFRFDRAMLDGYWGLIGDPSATPHSTAIPRFDETKRILTIPVKLEPGHEYRFSLNSEGVRAFRSADGVALEPVPVSFTTRAKP